MAKHHDTQVGKHVKAHEVALAAAIHATLELWGKKLAKQATQGMVEKSDADEVKKILARMRLEGFSVDLVDELTPAMLKAFQLGGAWGVLQVHLENNTDITKHLDLAAKDYAAKRGVELVKDFSDTTRDSLRSVIERGVTEGMAPAKLAKTIQESGSFSDARAKMIARTELAFAHVQGNVAGWRESGEVEGKQWILGDLHDHEDECLLAGTLISAVRPSRGIKRHYKGSIFEIVLGNGKKLSGTPNHPVLTDCGWMPLCRLQEGSKLLSDTSLKGIPAIADYFNEVKIRIDDVVNSFCGRTKVKETAAADFHGDGAGSKVHTILTNCALSFKYSQLRKHFAKSSFISSFARIPFIPCLRNIGVGLFETVKNSLWPGFLRPQALAFTVRPQSVAVPLQSLHNSSLRQPNPQSNLPSREILLKVKSGNILNGDFAAALRWERVISVFEHENSVVEVFNLTTEAGFFSAEGIITSNCDECADAGVVPLDADFIPGYAWPPAHPNCICDISPILKPLEGEAA